MSQPFPPLYPTADACKTLAKRLALPYSDGMQDWEWEVADVMRFNEFVHTYCNAELDAHERFSLMEILIQCVEDCANTTMFNERWYAIEQLLTANRCFHMTTIAYWSLTSEVDPSYMFNISSRMRNLL
jgi:hypothetical protein